MSQASSVSRDDVLIDADELASILGRSRAAVYNLRYRHLLPPAVKIGTTIRWRRSEIDRWLEDSLDDGGGR